MKNYTDAKPVYWLLDEMFIEEYLKSAVNLSDLWKYTVDQENLPNSLRLALQIRLYMTRIRDFWETHGYRWT